MSSDSTGAAAAPGLHPGDAVAVKPTGLHSPPDSNNVDDDSSDSELSDFDEAIADADDVLLDTPPPPATMAPAPLPDPSQPPAPTQSDPAEAQPEQVPTPEQDEDIGEVLPDHWSGTVPVFKPTMEQFKDFKKFVRRFFEEASHPPITIYILTLSAHRWEPSTRMA